MLVVVGYDVGGIDYVVGVMVYVVGIVDIGVVVGCGVGCVVLLDGGGCVGMCGIFLFGVGW